MIEWLTTKALPALMTRGLAPNGAGFVERFDWRGAPIDPGFKRIRVTARQTYVLCHAALGGVVGAREAALAGARFLAAHGLREDGQFVSRLTSDGAVLEASADLYDIAFGLFAMAWWHRLTGDTEPVDIALRSVMRLRATLASPTGRGFVAREAGPVAHEQNPHMHLFEAAIFLAQFTGQPEFRLLADELFQLFCACLFDPASGTLAEFFDAEWQAGSAGRAIRIEPGHHYEWTWLLSRYGDLADAPDAFAIADRLFDFAWRHGHAPQTGLIVDALDRRGAVVEPDLRLWPNTEFLKAQVVMQERHGTGEGFCETAIDANLARIFRYFLTPQAAGPAAALGEGLWIDHLESASMTPRCNHVPASAFYHIMFGFSEVCRHRADLGRLSGLPW